MSTDNARNMDEGAKQKNQAISPLGSDQSSILDPLRTEWHARISGSELSEEGKRKDAAFRACSTAYADAIIDLLPFGRAQSVALSKLQELHFAVLSGVSEHFPVGFDDLTAKQGDAPEERKTEQKSQ